MNELKEDIRFHRFTTRRYEEVPNSLLTGITNSLQGYKLRVFRSETRSYTAVLINTFEICDCDKHPTFFVLGRECMGELVWINGDHFLCIPPRQAIRFPTIALLMKGISEANYNYLVWSTRHPNYIDCSWEDITEQIAKGEVDDDNKG